METRKLWRRKFKVWDWEKMRTDCLLSSSWEILFPEDYCGSCDSPKYETKWFPTKSKIQELFETAYKDINWNYIYEWDILERKYFWWTKPERSIIVVWVMDECSTDEYWQCVNIWDWAWVWFEIIGNKFENEELLIIKK